MPRQSLVLLFVTWSIISALGGLLPTWANADIRGEERQRVHLRLFTGLGLTKSGDLRIRQPRLGTDLLFERVTWEHHSLTTRWTRDSIPYTGLRAERFFQHPSWLAASVEVVHFKITATPQHRIRVRGADNGTPIDTVAPFYQFVQQYRVTNSVNLLLGNLQAHRGIMSNTRFPHGQLDVYTGIGSGVTIPHTSSSIDGDRLAGYEWGRPALQALAGISWRTSEHWDLSLEYKFTRTTVDGSVANGDSRSRLHTNHLPFGFGYQY